MRVFTNETLADGRPLSVVRCPFPATPTDNGQRKTDDDVSGWRKLSFPMIDYRLRAGGDLAYGNQLDVHLDQHVRSQAVADARRQVGVRRITPDADRGTIVTRFGRMIDDDLEVAELGKDAERALDLCRMHEHALDLANAADLPDEGDARRRIAAGTGLAGEPEDVARCIAQQRHGALAELCDDHLAAVAGADRRTALRIEELDPHLARVQVHAVVRAALTGQGADHGFTAVVEELDAEPRLQRGAQRRRQRLG